MAPCHLAPSSSAGRKDQQRRHQCKIDRPDGECDALAQRQAFQKASHMQTFRTGYVMR